MVAGALLTSGEPDDLEFDLALVADSTRVSSGSELVIDETFLSTASLVCFRIAVASSRKARPASVQRKDLAVRSRNCTSTLSSGSRICRLNDGCDVQCRRRRVRDVLHLRYGDEVAQIPQFHRASPRSANERGWARARNINRA